MLNFSANTLIENIGALELGAMTYSLDDAGLEASVGPATPTGGAWTQVCCRRIDDGVLENAAVIVMAGPTVAPCTVMTCPRRIDDGALEAAAAIAAAPSYNMGCSSTQGQMCRRIDDNALETAAVMTASPSFDTVCGSTMGPRCFHRVDDGAN